MFYRDHNPPHFHAEYAENKALIDIQKLELWGGYLPLRVLSFVIEWAAMHQKGLKDNWENARRQEALIAIDPLV